MKEIKPGIIVQLDPDKTENKMFSGCLMIVTKMKDWGVQGYVQALGKNGKPGGQAYYRAKFGTFFPVQNNCAPWVLDGGDNVQEENHKDSEREL